MNKFELKSSTGYMISCMEWPVVSSAEFPLEDGIVVCLHGFAGDKYSSVIEAVANALTHKGKRVLTFDWPGHGDSAVSGDMLTIDNCIADLKTVFEYCRGQNATSCFATSFGGYLAMIYRDRYPNDFSKYMLRSPALMMPDILLSFMTEEQKEEYAKGEKLNFGFDRPLMLDQSFHQDLCNNKVIGSAGEIFIIHGDQDDTVPIKDSYAFAEKYGLKLYVVKGADHRYKNPGELEQIVVQAVGYFQ